MKKLMIVGFAAMMAVVVGCFTSATAQTEKKSPDGSSTKSSVRIIGTGDKASEVAAEGLFADGATGDEGAGVKSAKASQQSTGIKEAFEGLATVLGPFVQAYMNSQSIKAPKPVSLSTAPAVIDSSSVQSQNTSEDTAPAVASSATDVEYPAQRYTGTPLSDGSGVYGKTNCSRCKSYLASHPDVIMIDLAVAANKTAMWDAIRRFDVNCPKVELPVVITSVGYTQGAK